MKNQRYIYYLIGTTLLLVIINTIFYLVQESQNEKNYLLTIKTTQIIETANSLLADIKDAETGQRGYLLTDNISYLAPYQEAEKRLDKTFNALYLLVIHNQSQLNTLRELKKWIRIKRDELALTIKLHDKQGGELALNRINTDVGKNAMEQIKMLIKQLEREEKFRLISYNESFNRLNARIQVFAIAGSYILLVIIFMALITIIQNREQIVTLFTQVGDKNKQLEHQKKELQTLSQGLIKQNSELERFAYVASHDLRSPGVNLSSLLQLYEASFDQEEKKELMQAIKEVSSNLLIKLDDLIEMLRNSNELTEASENLNFEEVYSKILKNYSAEVKKTGAAIDYDFSEAPAITYPKPYLESIMQNLITNAIKYRHPDRLPHISIRTYQVEDKIYMTVQDNGLGIDLKKYGNQLFGIYRTFHGGKDSKGIGLYITKAQIIAMGGSIEVNSTPGEGTTFSICFY